MDKSSLRKLVSFAIRTAQGNQPIVYKGQKAQNQQLVDVWWIVSDGWDMVVDGEHMVENGE